MSHGPARGHGPGRPEHDHEHEHRGLSLDWFRILDVAVWVSVLIIAGLLAEWMIGYVARERIAAQASKFLRSRAPSTTE